MGKRLKRLEAENRRLRQEVWRLRFENRFLLEAVEAMQRELGMIEELEDWGECWIGKGQNEARTPVG